MNDVKNNLPTHNPSNSLQNSLTFLSNLHWRQPTADELALLDLWLETLAEKMAELDDNLACKGEELAMLARHEGFGSSRYRIPGPLYHTANEALDLAARAREAESFESMVAHLRMLEPLLDLAFNWGYGTHLANGSNDILHFSQGSEGVIIENVIRSGASRR